MGKGMHRVVVTVGLIISIMSTERAFGAHPLITDDTGTQGKGKIQMEFLAEYVVDKKEGITEKSYETPTVPFIACGLTDSIDLIFGLPHASIRVEEAGTATSVRGVTDASIELKARFCEKDGLSLALKPGISLPTGDEEKGLGNGKVSYSAFFIATREAWPRVFHFNVGYTRNELKLQAYEEAQRKDIWHISLASQVEIAKNLYLIANIGTERNPDKTSDAHPAFILGGLIYAVSENVDFDLGIKRGLITTETDSSVLVGITWRLEGLDPG